MLSSPFQINLDLTEQVNDNESNFVIQHDCLHIPAKFMDLDIREIISYCMSEWPSQWNIRTNNLDKIFTFANLSHLNITSQQLYLWSAPMDIIEKYQIYLNQLLTSNETALAMYLYYNCTLPRFGSMCQYSFDDYDPNHVSLYEFTYEWYLKVRYEKRNQSCYMHLQCSLGETPLCIEWYNICDGIIQCIDGVDEEHCWKLEVNDCKDDEYRCFNGQCIPLVFNTNGDTYPDCFDPYEAFIHPTGEESNLFETPFRYEDHKCMMNSLRLSDQQIDSCHDTYNALFKTLLFANKPNSMDNICWLALLCYFESIYSWQLNCNDFCSEKTCQEKIQQNCSNIFYMPSAPVAFGHIYFVYTKQYIIEQKVPTMAPEYVCYNKELCNGSYLNRPSISFNGTICTRFENIPIGSGGYGSWTADYVHRVHERLSHCNTIFRNDSSFCNKTTMYQCINSSKCIANVRVLDNIIDCDYGDDETLTMINNIDFIKHGTMHIYCTVNKIFISRKLMVDYMCNCGYDIYDLCEDLPSNLNYITEHISFPTICDGSTQLKPILINGQNLTDETECELWLCNNTYTRCNGIWNCLNGADEVDCYPSLLKNCPRHSYLCFSFETSELMCLSINKINDGNIDCLGAIDEQQVCAEKNPSDNGWPFSCQIGFDTIGISFAGLCDGINNCLHGDDERFCAHISNHTELFGNYGKCTQVTTIALSNIEYYFCSIFTYKCEFRMKFFSLNTIRKTRSDITTNDNARSLTSTIPLQNQHRCHRGIDLRVWLDSKNNHSTTTCLCSPNYYGNKCQYQNQRVNFVAQFQAYTDSWKTPFILIVTLIDDSYQRIIHSHTQLTYIPVPNCKTKYIVDLLYSIRPKNQSQQYSIHIDIYEKISLLYRGSLLVRLPFPFLPVERISVLLRIPYTNDNFQSCSDHNCMHGQCIRYFNDPDKTTFCRCHEGWSGRYCSIEHVCTCASGSLCVGILPNNQSICVCPIDKWGSRCLLDDHICQFNISCQHEGLCIPFDRYSLTNKQFKCICPNGFFGEICEKASNKIILSFNKDIIIPQSMLIHFIEVKDDGAPENGTTLKKIPVAQNSITIYWSRPFHIAFVEFYPNNYYLITVQQTCNRSMTIEKTLKLTDHCLHIRDIFDESITNLHLLRRIKYYHIPCQQYKPLLSCFYDDGNNNSDGHICLCYDFDGQRQANCFEFNHQKKFDCGGQSNCENGAQCLQDSFDCPTTSMCVCLPCFYGTRCQFSTNGFSLSLDSILGYHIQPHVNINHQPTIVKISIMLNIMFITVGTVNGLLSLITFLNKEPRKSGCGFYLIGSSITTLSTMIFFACKFWILIYAQKTYITNRLFLKFQCSSIDFLLRISLNMDQWLNACVTMERAITVIQGVNFNKKKSKRLAKFIISALLITVISTLIHDPYHRTLIDDDDNDEKRIWCIVTYSSNVQLYDSIINIVHFIIPFIINFISAIIIIIQTSRSKTAAKTDQSYRKVLHEQLKQHKHLLIIPVILIVLGIPRLIISFASGCMNSTADSWLFLSGYFIFFVPPTITFIIHVLPSKFYKKELNKTIQRYRKTIRERIQRQ
ncbi:unnamed protein product [Adineta steineri]|uniref:Uncharacterized protein n=1 Tax=Adineta steineri TaxID=433720 RepID=A0A815S4M3_9BILA|nr:unnamed protein product [Adineta steineri]